jgi:spore coat polysaccharide biosynthesis protein SpsF (cytidylyltransferase family)
MKNYYEEKMNFHFKEYQLSVDAKKDKAAAHHMREYLNYKQMHENKKGSINE